MDKDAIMRELNGQTMKLIEVYMNKNESLKEIENHKTKLGDYDLQIREITGVIQTLQVVVQTEGFSNMSMFSPKEGEPFKMEHIQPSGPMERERIDPIKAARPGRARSEPKIEE